MRVTYRDSLRGRELLNVEIDVNDLQPAGCPPAQLDFIPEPSAN